MRCMTRASAYLSPVHTGPTGRVVGRVHAARARAKVCVNGGGMCECVRACVVVSHKLPSML